jgi:hypothetical protein
MSYTINNHGEIIRAKSDTMQMMKDATSSLTDNFTLLHTLGNGTRTVFIDIELANGSWKSYKYETRRSHNIHEIRTFILHAIRGVENQYQFGEAMRIYFSDLMIYKAYTEFNSIKPFL